MTVADFNQMFKKLPKDIFIINAEIYDGNEKFKFVERWDWIRLGDFPKADEILLEMASKNPNKYRRTKFGIWIKH